MLSYIMSFFYTIEEEKKLPFDEKDLQGVNLKKTPICDEKSYSTTSILKDIIKRLNLTHVEPVVPKTKFEPRHPVLKELLNKVDRV